MAANTGAKIVRDFFRESPCRMAYAITQRKVAAQQQSRNLNLRRISSRKVVRPQTAPIAATHVAQAVKEQAVMEAAKRRPTTSGRPLRPTSLVRRDRSRSSRRPTTTTIDNRKSPVTSSVNVRKQQPSNGHHKQSKAPGQDKKPPGKPCKVCTEDSSFNSLWQDLLNEGPSRKQPDNLGSLITKIETIRSELLSEEGLKHVTFRDSVQLINEVRHRISSFAPSFLDRLEPSQTERLARKSRSRKSFRTLPFEGGRISGKDYAHFRKGSMVRGEGSVTKFKVTSAVKPSGKKFEEGPLRTLFALEASPGLPKRVQF